MKTRSSLHGGSTSASVENITPWGFWLLVGSKEYFLDFEEYPYFRDQTVAAIHKVQLLHGYHLYWPDLDVDLELDNLENPAKYPLRARTTEARVRRARGRLAAVKVRTVRV